MNFSRAHTILVAIACAIAFSSPARADSWNLPTVRTVYSPSSNFVVRVTPGDIFASRRDAKPGTHPQSALVEFYAAGRNGKNRLLWRTNSLNPEMPVTIQVSDQGHLVLLDNWHSVGYGTVFTLFAPDGRMVRGSTREELLGTNRIVNAKRSVSSLWWHKGGRFGTGTETNLYILKLGAENPFPAKTNAADDGELLIQLQTGSVSRRFPVPSAAGQTHKAKP